MVVLGYQKAIIEFTISLKFSCRVQQQRILGEIHSESEIVMPIATLEQVESLAESLSPLDQLRLIQRLAPKIATSIVNTKAQPRREQQNLAEDAWQHFFAIGDILAAEDRKELPTLTSTLQTMRR